VPVLPEPTQLLALVAVPISLIWLVRTTINHARSFEDALRRIEHQEHLINERLGVDVMGFQRSHPSKGSTVGGRTGTESVVAVAVAACVLLVGCWVTMVQIMIQSGSVLWVVGVVHLTVMIEIARSIHGWRIYRYSA
jgi:hypothetical protein